MPRILHCAFVVVAVALLAACSSLPSNLQTPAVSLLGVQMTSGDMFSQRFKVRVKIENPNDLEVPVESIDYTIYLMGDRFGEGASEAPFVLPALGEAEFDMMVTTDFVSSLGRVISRMGGNKLENVEYNVTGKLHLQKGVVRTIPFSHAGVVNFSKPK
jgi:LEA14-like dessication related protein